MKTVIIDNSLCTLPIAEGTSPELICRYIHALAETGVKYVELDFRTVMKMQELPDAEIRLRAYFDDKGAQQLRLYDHRTGEGACMALKKRVYGSDRRLPHGRKEDGAGHCAEGLQRGR